MSGGTARIIWKFRIRHLKFKTNHRHLLKMPKIEVKKSQVTRCFKARFKLSCDLIENEEAEKVFQQIMLIIRG